MKNSRATLFFRESAGYSKLLNNKKYIFGTVNSGNPLFFTASTSCLKIQNVKCNFKQQKISGQLCFFRESAGYSKLLNNKKYTFNAVKISGQLCFSGQALVAQKS